MRDTAINNIMYAAKTPRYTIGTTDQVPTHHTDHSRRQDMPLLLVMRVQYAYMTAAVAGRQHGMTREPARYATCAVYVRFGKATYRSARSPRGISKQPKAVAAAGFNAVTRLSSPAFHNASREPKLHRKQISLWNKKTPFRR